MDNVTHALVGLVAAELVVRARQRRGAMVGHFVRPAYFTSAAANNLPDLDFVYAGITEGPLGYLMHHRGHTHTLVAAPLMALIAWALGRWWLRKTSPPDPGAERWIALLALAGPLLHVGMDFCNSYGVHPFWPLDNGWVYGDSVFIVEPLFWAITVPLLLFCVRAWWGRALLGLVLAATIVLPWVTGFVPPVLAALVTLLTAGMLLLSWRVRPLPRVVAGTLLSFVVLGVFVAAGAFARSASARVLARDFPDARTADLVLSPMPANPICWSLIAVQTEDHRLAARRARVSLWPAAMPAQRCPSRGGTEITAPIAPVDAPATADVAYDGQFVAPLVELRMLAADNCRFATLLRFARVPFWKRDDAKRDELVAGDLRYDRDPTLDFAELAIPDPPKDCPRFVPGWRPPRHDLLTPPAH